MTAYKKRDVKDGKGAQPPKCSACARAGTERGADRSAVDAERARGAGAPAVGTAAAAARTSTGAAQPALGLESEFTLVLDGQPTEPEKVFRTPRDFVRGPMNHREGRSYQLPTGNAVYFDTGVIELATPIVELGPRCAAQAGRSLWESIQFVRGELDAWQEREGHQARLSGFSTHCNVSFDLPAEEQGKSRTVKKLAVLLTYILPFPVMLMGANRESTGVGCRPRRERIEVTSDFTPDPALAIATATLIVGIIREVMRWPSYELEVLEDVRFPVLRDFAPVPHSSRKGWVANCSCFAENPFVCGVDRPVWPTRDGQVRSLRDIARGVVEQFWPSIRTYAHPRSLRLVRSILAGQTQSLLELPQRPESYEDVGHACSWNDLFSERSVSRSRYEQALLTAITKTPVEVLGEQFVTAGMNGWTHAVLRRVRDGERRTVSLEELAAQLDLAA